MWLYGWMDVVYMVYKGQGDGKRARVTLTSTARCALGSARTRGSRCSERSSMSKDNYSYFYDVY